ncbi:putative alcohol dehydrogenase [Lyophyllum shimeji]|uniref:Alcohol dehydrogenase n=1 Tax=Lyophyllum shimeji TaxID=47721 RepID=A0A9P3PWL8_LYOSH|nr:putative alcohol dehydrogenase [Lyophyllum shimeji]
MHRPDIESQIRCIETRCKVEVSKEGPIEIYWDHVGGETSEVALDSAAQHARFIECGMISGYNEGHRGVSNLFNLSRTGIQVTGFQVSSLWDKYDSAGYY